jgi:hypothetical protein
MLTTTRHPLPNFFSTVYSLGVRQSPLLALLLGTLVVQTGFLFIGNSPSTSQGMDWKIGFFILIPFGLGVLVWLQFRWAAVVCIVYATVGLAMDVATIAQTSTKDSDAVASMMASGISGLFYLCLIVFGWQWFLREDQRLMPPESRPPSPPSLS